jgi:hypothetical protein
MDGCLFLEENTNSSDIPELEVKEVLVEKLEFLEKIKNLLTVNNF